MFKIINILNNDEWKNKCLEKLKTVKLHHQKNNYKNFENRLKKYLEFHIVIQDNEILAMSGIWNYGYPKNIARVLDRTLDFNWNNKKIPWTERRYPKLMIEHQTKIAKDLKLDSVFFSVEEKKSTVKWLCKQFDYKPLNDVYYVCGHEPKELSWNCWQFIGAKFLSSNNKINLPNVSYNYFLKNVNNDKKRQKTV